MSGTTDQALQLPTLPTQQPAEPPELPPLPPLPPPFLITTPGHHYDPQYSTGIQQESGPYQCTVCSRSFAQQRGLMRHQRERHKIGGVRMHGCPVCQKLYTRKYVLVQHIVKAHPYDRVEPNDLNESVVIVGAKLEAKEEVESDDDQ